MFIPVHHQTTKLLKFIFFIIKEILDYLNKIFMSLRPGFCKKKLPGNQFTLKSLNLEITLSGNQFTWKSIYLEINLPGNQFTWKSIYLEINISGIEISLPGNRLSHFRPYPIPRSFLQPLSMNWSHRMQNKRRLPKFICEPYYSTEMESQENEISKF